jgi:radical SAM/Cys-rich protein
LAAERHRPDFEGAIARHGFAPMRRHAPDTLQINVGKLCNQACHHCHVDAGPKRTEIMTRATAERVVRLMRASTAIRTVDITGGAPELNPNFRYLVESARDAARAVIVRCNLTVIFAPGMEWLPRFYRDNGVHLICSLPCYTAENVEKQRGRGVFEKSIEALKILNSLDYGHGLALDLVYNPIGASLPPAQPELERQYRDRLDADFGVRFNRLLTITNMPISRFAEQLDRWGKFGEYMSLLIAHFNPFTIEGLMCRNILSVGYDGRLYDCDFNQMLAIPIGAGGGADMTIWELDDAVALADARIATGAHCFGCTAGAGSSCGGALAPK